MILHAKLARCTIAGHVLTSPARTSRYSLALALGVLAIFALHLQAWTFLCDDAYITFRYARNLAETGLPVYNLNPLERVEGYTNPGWVFLLAAFSQI